MSQRTDVPGTSPESFNNGTPVLLGKYAERIKPVAITTPEKEIDVDAVLAEAGIQPNKYLIPERKRLVEALAQQLRSGSMDDPKNHVLGAVVDLAVTYKGDIMRDIPPQVGKGGAVPLAQQEARDIRAALIRMGVKKERGIER